MQIDTMTLEQLDATMAQLREQKKLLKQGGKAAVRKIGTLNRRRERLLVKVQEIDGQIIALRSEVSVAPNQIPSRRGRRLKVSV
ncbi:MAG: hypothetical protein ACYDBB_04820 [Armatimonadota bacterium]